MKGMFNRQKNVAAATNNTDEQKEAEIADELKENDNNIQSNLKDGDKIENDSEEKKTES